MSKTLLLPPRSLSLIVFESVASVALIILSLVGNVLILTALYRNPRLRNTTNNYIAALAVTDLLSACVPGTLFASTLIAGRLVFGMPLCRLSGFLVHFLTYFSMTTMTLTAVNRYFRVVRPQLYRKLFTKTRSRGILVVFWLVIAGFVFYPTALGMGTFTFNPVLSFCAYTFASQSAETVFTVTVVCVFVVFSLSVICVCYYHVSKEIRRHNVGIRLSLQGVSVQEINLSKVLFIVAFAFALCWIPTFVVVLIIRVILDGAPHELAVVIPFLIQTSSVLNPLIYGVLSPPFRREFRRLFTPKWRARSGDINSNASSPIGQIGLALEQISIGHPCTGRDSRRQGDGSDELAQFPSLKVAWSV